ncbi:MAG: twin-arginine translocation signal domain-containing protein, partial [Candidatus Binatia bacterium]
MTTCQIELSERSCPRVDDKPAVIKTIGGTVSAPNGKLPRREFLKRSAMLGISAALGGALSKASYAASKERLMILSSIGLDTLNPYGHSS